MSAQQLPQFKCHKVVSAFKIDRIVLKSTGATLYSEVQDDNSVVGYIVDVSKAYLEKHNPEVGGYYVQYPDGYESFSPAAAFEEGYTLIAPSTFRSRLYDEHAQLQDRTDKLEKFITTEAFDALPEVDRVDLKVQLRHMQEYLQVLSQRVSRLCNNA